MRDVQFPVIQYQAATSPREWGRGHGESFREAIHELTHIRTELMREKNPQFTSAIIEQLAAAQWQKTLSYDSQLAEELQGIAEGAKASIKDIVVVNNYTDFRDIEVTDQGCSAVFVQREGRKLAGQTWDMHGSAKRFVCCLKIPASDSAAEQVVFSIVGCVGMMGYSANRRMVGVNNINTNGARPGVLWPVVIRKLLKANSLKEQQSILQTAPLTSGRSFLLVGPEGGAFWEVMPDLSEKVSALPAGRDGELFHTNHCLGERSRERETKIALTSTTYTRFDLLTGKVATVKDLDSAWHLLNDHEGYPRSICSNFQTNSQDPSITCGGAVGDLNTGLIRMWRGDKLYDSNFVEHQFDLRPSIT